jgi:ubiquinone/menaquinone biosynthesis C-methylase UbiE
MTIGDESLTLNVGCGNETQSDVRMDLFPTSATNIVADAQHFPFREDIFTEIYEKNLLEHIPNPALHLFEVCRALKKGGTLTLITDNAACLKYYLLGTHTGGYSKHGGKDKHYALFTEEHVKNLLQLSGLEVGKIELIDTDYFTNVFDRVIRLFAPSLSHPRISATGKKN